jgi:dTDP-L-rhamnose 4-epimerase
MGERVLITGGAGFVGSHLADELLAAGYRVRALDALVEQVHGPGRARPAYLDGEVELVVGDVRDPAAVHGALRGVDAVVHLAAAVGVGQSMYRIAEYVGVNAGGTAVLLEELARRPVRRLVAASSMSVYGEGLYRDAAGRPAAVGRRRPGPPEARVWDFLGADGTPLEPAPTPEGHPPDPASVYALTKYDQERLCLLAGRAYGIEAVALRFFNIYGARQALGNPYTGVLAIFAARLLGGRPPLVYEDGRQRRDFVAVADVARACRLALEVPGAAGHALNVAGGRPVTVREVAARMAEALGKPGVAPRVTGQYRVGDVRHCFADLGLARRVLGYEPRVGLADGLAALAAWLEGQAPPDRLEDAAAELAARGVRG